MVFLLFYIQIFLWVTYVSCDSAMVDCILPSIMSVTHHSFYKFYLRNVTFSASAVMCYYEGESFFFCCCCCCCCCYDFIIRTNIKFYINTRQVFNLGIYGLYTRTCEIRKGKGNRTPKLKGQISKHHRSAIRKCLLMAFATIVL